MHAFIKTINQKIFHYKSPSTNTSEKEENNWNTERKIIKEWTQKAKKRNEKEPTDSKVVWRVRGSPEKLIYLKKFVLSNQTTNNGYDN